LLSKKYSILLITGGRTYEEKMTLKNNQIEQPLFALFRSLYSLIITKESIPFNL